MKIIADKFILINAINTVQKAISNKTTIEVHKDIYIETINNNTIKLIGNDLNLGIETTINVNVQAAGRCTVNSRLFGEIIKKMPSEIIEIELLNNILNIQAGNSKFQLKSGNVDEFMLLEKINQNHALIIDKYILSDMIKQTIFATSNDDARPILNGLLFNIQDNLLTMVGLDLYRIAIKKYKIQSEQDYKIVIPAKTLSELQKIINDDSEEENVKLYITDKFIKFTYHNIVVISRLLEGEYLDYEQAIPNKHNVSITCSRQELYKAIDRAALIASQDNNKSLLFDIEENLIKISTNSELGSVNEIIMAKTEGQHLKIGFNTRYWLDILKVIDSDDVKLYLSDSIYPCLVHPSDNQEYSYIIFPVRIAPQ